jgi:hypothetical protein
VRFSRSVRLAAWRPLDTELAESAVKSHARGGLARLRGVLPGLLDDEPLPAAAAHLVTDG